MTTAELAVLVDKFNLRPHEIAKLTDYQIRCLYFHARDDKGIIEFPRFPKTKVEEIKDALASVHQFGMGAKENNDKIQEAERKLLEKLKIAEEEERLNGESG